jgi:hypothetical protein
MPEINASNAPFNFASAYITPELNSNMNILVQGFSGTELLYSLTATAISSQATLVDFDFQNVTRVTFTPPETGQQFVMDNVSIDIIPEPSSFILAAVGLAGILGLHRRRR